MTVPKELRFSHNFDSKETRDTAERRAFEMSKPGSILSVAAYINRLIREDGLRHPDKSKSNTSNKKK